MTTDSVRSNGIVAAGWIELSITQEQFALRDPRFLRQLRSLLQLRRGVASAWAAAHLQPDVVPAAAW